MKIIEKKEMAMAKNSNKMMIVASTGTGNDDRKKALKKVLSKHRVPAFDPYCRLIP